MTLQMYQKLSLCKILQVNSVVIGRYGINRVNLKRFVVGVTASTYDLNIDSRSLFVAVLVCWQTIAPMSPRYSLMTHCF